MKIQLLSDITEEVPENSTDFGWVKSTLNGKEPMLESSFTYSVPFVAGRIYNIWWHTGIDFEKVNIDVSALTEDNDPAIIFKFNYTLNRELYELRDVVNGQLGDMLKNMSSDPLEADSCFLG